MQDAVYDSSGTFSLDPVRARLAREGKLFPSPAHWLLRFVQAAHVAGAGEAHLGWGMRTTTARWPLPGRLEAAPREMLLDAAWGAGADCEVQLTCGQDVLMGPGPGSDGEVVLRVTRGWTEARRFRLQEYALVGERCRPASLRLTLERKEIARELPRPHQAPWFDLHSFRKPQWLGVSRGRAWTDLGARPKPLAQWTTQADCLIALSASVEGTTQCYPVQNGVALDPVEWKLPGIGLLVYWNADGLKTDLGGFQLLEGAPLRQARAGVQEEVKNFLRRLRKTIPSLQPRFASRGDTSLKQFLGLIGGGLGMAAGGPLGGLAGAVAGPKFVDVVNYASRHETADILRREWLTRLTGFCG